MKINKLKITNFKLFIESEFKFHPNFNLIVGVNGRGKTSLLRAVSVALGGWAHAYIKDKKNLRPILKDEIRQIETNGRFDNMKTVRIEAFGSASIVDRFNSLKEGEAKWSRILNEDSDQTSISGDIRYGNCPRWYNLKFNLLGSDILSYIEKGNNFDLPLIAFYECNRLWSSDNNQNHKSTQSALIEEVAKKQYSRFHPYQDCFHTALHDDDITEWLLKNELVSLQDKKDGSVSRPC
jgi:predicted ATP-binding protein involved in virulence